jgi:hypothetical protein
VDTFVNGDLKVKILASLLALTVIDPAYADVTADYQKFDQAAQTPEVRLYNREYAMDLSATEAPAPAIKQPTSALGQFA